MAFNVRKGKRKFLEISDSETEKSAASDESTPCKTTHSSPIKSPLMDNGTESGTQSFVAKSFYGFKRTQNDLSSPPRNKFSPKKIHTLLKISRDPIINEKILESIANSPVKQAVLESCSLEEFRRLYRGEIKDIETKNDLDKRKFTRSVSKIVYRRNNSDDDDESEDDCVSVVDEEISFKISNRGFDIDSASDCSSLKVQSPASIKDKCILRDSPNTNYVDSDDEVSSNGTANEVRLNSPSQENSPVLSHTPSPSMRKFFKTKSVHDSVNSGSIVLGKNFNLRFVSRSHSKNMNTQRKKKTATPVVKPRRLSLGDKMKSPSVLTNRTNSKMSVINSVPPNKAVETDHMKDELEDDLTLKKESRTYESISPKLSKDNDDGPCMSNSLPESEQIIVESKKMRASPTESFFSSNEDVSPSTEGFKKERSGSSRRLFSIFTSGKSSGIVQGDGNNYQTPKPYGMKAVKDDQSQMVIDAGQKKFGATQCNVCSMVYCHADPMDEVAHTKFHNRLLEVLKFPGWKKGRDVQEFPDDCGHVVMVMSEDPKYCRKKVEEIYELMERDLGFPGTMPFSNPYQKVFFYVSSDKKIEGCCVAEPIKEGYRVIPGDLDTHSASGRRPWCCNKKPEPAILGISRLWVAGSSRRNGVATRLVDSVRQWFDYGSLVPKYLLAFSDPTPDGRRFAEKYFGSPQFLVYKYR